jgi:hypothetical protein
MRAGLSALEYLHKDGTFSFRTAEYPEGLHPHLGGGLHVQFVGISHHPAGRRFFACHHQGFLEDAGRRLLHALSIAQNMIMKKPVQFRAFFTEPLVEGMPGVGKSSQPIT